MRKLNLAEWASLAEIIGTTAVVISLLILAYNINRNTVVMQASSENLLYELQFARGRDIVSSPGMALIYSKRKRNEELSEEELERFLWDKLQEVSGWEFAFTRHRDGLFSTQQWEDWDKFFEVSLTNELSKESWSEVRHWYSEDFRSHVDAVYAKK